MLNELPFYRDIVLVVKKDTNEHCVAFVWNGKEVEPIWILKGPDGLSHKPFNMLERALAGVALTDVNGRLEITFTFPIGLHKTLYFVSTPEGERNFAVVFKNDYDKLSKLEEVFVMMSSGTCMCRCRQLNGIEFVESFPIDMGPLASFL